MGQKVSMTLGGCGAETAGLSASHLMPGVQMGPPLLPHPPFSDPPIPQ